MRLPSTAGLEIETSLISGAVQLPEGWVQTLDGSCGGDHGGTGSEFVSPKISTLQELTSQVRETCEAVGARTSINSRCGLHAHVGFKHIPDLSAKYRLFRLASRYEQHFFDLCRPWQERAAFCQPLQPLHWEAAKTGRGFDAFVKDARFEDRYWWFNGASMHKHGTIEFRLHNGTLEADEIIGWACLLQCLVRRALDYSSKVDWTPARRGSWSSFQADVIGHEPDELSTLATRYVQRALNAAP